MCGFEFAIGVFFFFFWVGMGWDGMRGMRAWIMRWMDGWVSGQEMGNVAMMGTGMGS